MSSESKPQGASPQSEVLLPEKREFFASDTVNSKITHRVRMRNIQGLHPKQRISYCNRTFDIINVINVNELNKDLELMCKELV